MWFLNTADVLQGGIRNLGCTSVHLPAGQHMLQPGATHMYGLEPLTNNQYTAI
jgi:hypothetical protein